MKIGIFDSGIGGLSVLRQAFQMFPEADYIYYADEEHVPYGEKSGDQIRGYVKDIINFFIERQVSAIVIACNTATASITKEFRSEFSIPIIGMEPAVKKAITEHENEDSRILVAATPFTIAGDKLHHLVESTDVDHEVDLIALPKLVQYAQNLEFETPEVEEYLQQALSKLDLNSYESLVLGCTHFNYFIPVFRKIFEPEIHFVDGNEGTIKQLLRNVGLDTSIDNEKSKESMECKIANTEFYISGSKADDSMSKRIQAYFEQLERVDMIQEGKLNE